MAQREKNMSRILRIDAQVVWEVAYDPESEMWIGVCPALNLNALGETQAEMQKCANEAVQALFADLYVAGELEEFLRKNNWGWQGNGILGAEPPRFDIPFEVRLCRLEAMDNSCVRERQC